MSYALITSPALRTGFRADFFPQLDETPGDAARDRPGGKLERLADRPVALVACEEAVEDLAAVLREPGQRVMDVEGLLQLGEHVVVGGLGQLLGVRRDLA